MVSLFLNQVVFRASGIQPGKRVPPEVREDILGGTGKHLTPIKTKDRYRLNLKPALNLLFTEIRFRTEVLACQKQA
jgi:hypothetical protein